MADTAYERDALGFLVGHRCPHCDAALYLSVENEAKGQRPICLNACNLPVWQHRIMQEGLRAAWARTNAREAATDDGEPSDG